MTMITSAPIRNFGPLTAGRLLGTMAFLLMPLALFASKALAPLFVITALLTFAMMFDGGRIRASLRKLEALGLFAFVAIAITSALWSIEPAASLRSAGILALVFFGGLFLADALPRLDDRQTKVLHRGIIAGGVLALVLIFFERATDASLTRAILDAKGIFVISSKDMMPGLNAGMSVLALFIWPWLLVVRRRYGNMWMALALLASVTAIILSDADTPLLAIGAGLLVAALSFAARKMMLSLMVITVVVGTTFAPLLPTMLPDPHTEARAYSKLSNSGVHRLAIWGTVAEHISKDPVLGIGFNATRQLYGPSDKALQLYATDDPSKQWGNFSEPIPLHAHNGVLQIWLELGGLGAFIFAGVLLMLMARIGRGFDDAMLSAARLGMLTSGIITFSLSFGPWQGWWQAAIWLMIALVSATGAQKVAEAH